MILDSDFLIDILRSDTAALHHLKKLEKEGLKLATTTINTFELINGVYLSSRQEENLRLVEDILKNLDIILFDLSASRVAGKLSSYFSKKGMMPNMMDTLIAAVCLLHNESIITKNLKHFQQVPGLTVETW